MRIKTKFTRMLLLSLVMLMCVSLFPTSAFAENMTSGKISKSFKSNAKFKIPVINKKVKLSKLGTFKVDGQYSFNKAPEDVDKSYATVKVYRNGSLLFNGTLDKDNQEITHKYKFKVFGKKLNLKVGVVYFPKWACLGIYGSIKGVPVFYHNLVSNVFRFVDGSDVKAVMKIIDKL